MYLKCSHKKTETFINVHQYHPVSHFILDVHLQLSSTCENLQLRIRHGKRIRNEYKILTGNSEGKILFRIPKCILFTYSFLNNAVSSSDGIVFSDRMINKRSGKDMEGSGHGLI
jgi:hypothetical protein